MNRFNDWERCSLCGKLIPRGKKETWAFGQTQIVLEREIRPAAEIDGPSEVLTICEDCYLAGALERMTIQVQGEIHYQFAVEYLLRGEPENALAAAARTRQCGLLDKAQGVEDALRRS